MGADRHACSVQFLQWSRYIYNVRGSTRFVPIRYGVVRVTILIVERRTRDGGTPIPPYARFVEDRDLCNPSFLGVVVRGLVRLHRAIKRLVERLRGMVKYMVMVRPCRVSVLVRVVRIRQVVKA